MPIGLTLPRFASVSPRHIRPQIHRRPSQFAVDLFLGIWPRPQNIAILSPQKFIRTGMNSSTSIFRNLSPDEFEQHALALFRHQSAHCAPYRNYLQHLGCAPAQVRTLAQIPFLPIELFKSHTVLCDGLSVETIFTSSGTTGTQTSRHHVSDLALYEASFVAGFEKFYGKITDYTILALLPAYLERDGSSLVYMAQRLIQLSGKADSGFYLHNLEQLAQKLQQLIAQEQKIILIGVSFALLDMAERQPMPLAHTIVMETGGMKGRRRELTRHELHSALCHAFELSAIHSEYGMTELLSQAYSLGNMRYHCPPWMQVRIRDTYDPFAELPVGRSGGINIIDLANRHSCAFIETKDLGRIHPDGSFEVLGRFDHSDIRGCNLLVN